MNEEAEEYNIIDEYLVNEFGAKIIEEDVTIIDDLYFFDLEFTDKEARIILSSEGSSFKKVNKKVLKKINEYLEKEGVKDVEITTNNSYYSDTPSDDGQFVIILIVDKKTLLYKVLDKNPSMIKHIGNGFKNVNIKKYSHLGNDYGMFDQVKEMKYIKRYAKR